MSASEETPDPEPSSPVTADPIGHIPILCLRSQGGYVRMFSALCMDASVSPEEFVAQLREKNPGWAFVPLTHEELIYALKARPG